MNDTTAADALVSMLTPLPVPTYTSRDHEKQYISWSPSTREMVTEIRAAGGKVLVRRVAKNKTKADYRGVVSLATWGGWWLRSSSETDLMR